MQIVLAGYESGASAAKAAGIWVNDSSIRLARVRRDIHS